MLVDSARIDGSSIANSAGWRMNFEHSPANLLHPLQFLPPSFSTIVIVSRAGNSPEGPYVGHPSTKIYAKVHDVRNNIGPS